MFDLVTFYLDFRMIPNKLDEVLALYCTSPEMFEFTTESPI